MSVRLYVGNLPKELDRQELAAVFAEAGDSVSTKVITDRKTGKCRGFGFVTVKTDEEADQIIEKYNGLPFKDAELKIEKALPRSKGKGDDDGSMDLDQDDDASIPDTVVSNGASGESAPSSKSSRRNKGNNKSRKSPGASSADSSDSVQPDPRWAQELEKLKQLLAAQATTP